MSQAFKRLPILLSFIIVFSISLAAQFFHFNAEQYKVNSVINLRFPVAAIDGGNPAIIEWHQYSKKADQYRGRLIANASNGIFSLADGRTFFLRPIKDGKIELELRDGMQRWYAEYVIESELARPLSLRQLNLNMIAIAALIASLAAMLVVVLQLRRQRN